jgi:hypothetical protein
MKIWLDDERLPPDVTWTHVKTPEAAIRLLATKQVEELSLDHDLGLGGPPERTGYDVLLWLEREVEARHVKPPAHITIHSANLGARRRMELAADSVMRRARETFD